MNAPRDHHFIPVFYLKQWASSKTKKLLEYTLKHGRLIEKPVGPHGTGFETDLYAFPELPPNLAQHMEQVFLQYADDAAARALCVHLGLDPPQWNSELISGWSRFIMTLSMRHPDAMTEVRAAVKAIWDRGGGETQRLYEAQRKPQDPATFEEYFEHLDPLLPVKAALNSIIKAFDNQTIGQHLNGMHFNVLDLVASSRTLLTSDRPLELKGLARPEASYFLPISPTKLYVAANDPETIKQLKTLKVSQLVEGVNKFVVKRARRFVYARDPWQREFIREHMSTAMEPLPLLPGLGNL
jgi:hypothetical protein